MNNTMSKARVLWVGNGVVSERVKGAAGLALFLRASGPEVFSPSLFHWWGHDQRRERKETQILTAATRSAASVVATKYSPCLTPP